LAIAAPIPFDAPVTTATLPFKSLIEVLHRSHGATLRRSTLISLRSLSESCVGNLVPLKLAVSAEDALDGCHRKASASRLHHLASYVARNA
jgi:hypothetical protein